MAQTLRQSTAVDVLIGPFVDLTDAATAETGESPSVKLSKNGQALAAKSDVTTPVHDADGYYNCELDATDTNTVGTMVLTVAASGTALPVRHEYQVIEEAAYDAMYAASAAGPLQSTTAGRTLDVTATGAAGIDWGNVENPTTTVDLSATDIQLADTVTTLTGHTAQTGDNFARLGAPAGASVSADVAAVKVDTAATLIDTAEIGAAGAGLTAINLPNQTMDITGNLSGSVGSVTGAVGSVTGAVGSVTGNVGGNVVGSVASVTAEVTADAVKISGSTAAADNLEESAEAIITGTAQTGTLSTTVMTSDLTGYLDDELIGRTVIWKSGTADGQASDITDYAAASGTVTYTAITTAPANGDLFVIV